MGSGGGSGLLREMLEFFLSVSSKMKKFTLYRHGICCTYYFFLLITSRMNLLMSCPSVVKSEQCVTKTLTSCS
jgi:hypothetical protein